LQPGLTTMDKILSRVVSGSEVYKFICVAL